MGASASPTCVASLAAEHPGAVAHVLIETRPLGRSGLQVPRIMLGCGNFGGVGSAPEFFGQGIDENGAFALMDAAWELGIRHFDTADAYGGGRSEQWIGDWMRATGNRPRVTSKTFNAMEDGADFGLARDRVLRQVETSLERLGVDRIDVYLTHEPDPDTPVEETYATLQALLDGGAIGTWGLSNVGAGDLREWLELGTPSLVQNSYSLLDRADEADVIPLCAEHEIAYQAFSPLSGGWLTGKYRRGEEVPAGSRMTMRPEPYRHLENDGVFDALAGLERSAADRGLSTAGLALAWALGGTSSIVVGPRRPGHLEPVREALLVSLSSTEREEVGSLFS
jgi:aryl-alcohol dehydrogenase-like predicted oxidoreductase